MPDNDTELTTAIDLAAIIERIRVTTQSAHDATDIATAAVNTLQDRLRGFHISSGVVVQCGDTDTYLSYGRVGSVRCLTVSVDSPSYKAWHQCTLPEKLRTFRYVPLLLREISEETQDLASMSVEVEREAVKLQYSLGTAAPEPAKG